MSVLIKGMEMPKSCDDCDFMYTVGPYADRICLFASDIEDSCKKAADCPLIEAPERKRGMWQWRTIIDDSPPIGQYECSQCGYPEPRMEIANYCPRCGADMRGDSDV